MTDRINEAFRPPQSDKDRAIDLARRVIRDPMSGPNKLLLARQLLRALALSEQG